MKLKDKKIVVTGGGGFLGSYVVRALRKRGVKDIFVPRSKDYDLRNREISRKVVKDAQIVIHLAAQMGGIGFINEHPGEVFYDNLIMGVQLMEASRIAGVKKFVGIGTACEYPETIPMPFKEEDIWKGSPEDVTAPYGWAKKMLIIQGKAYEKQYGFNAVHILPVNLYGPGDNFDPKSSPVISSLIRRIINARDTNSPTVEVWGTGKATREFLYVEDAAQGILLATERYNSPEPVNLGTGVETSIHDVVKLIMELAEYNGEIKWENTKPDGQPRRQLDVSKAKKEFGFVAKKSFREGLKKTIEWYEQHRV
ncbi:MAG: GDP-L-fucose synthase [Candidatus Levybacteria bacterium]|nr:GDP-L-fucose synthase [Candidatus Levybacteria bacterium]